MSAAAAAFSLLAGWLWCALFGYPLLLAALGRRRRAAPAPAAPLPRVAVVVPVLDEEAHIAGKLDDLRRTDYPPELITLRVVDGGSADRTPVILREAAAGDPRLSALFLEGRPGLGAQVAAALASVDEEIVVVTDADSRLDPSCIRRLVDALVADPRASVVGAAVRPETPLAEERLYWGVLNWLWHREGEAFGGAGVPGPAFALRRGAVPAPAAGVLNPDMNLAIGAAASGRRARLCPEARARELRVPRDYAGFLEFRRRRGRGYLRELLPAHAGAPARWRFVRAVRLVNLRTLPALLPAAAAAGALAARSPDGHWVPGAAVGLLGASWLVAAFALRRDDEGAPGRGRWLLAAAVLPALLWVALLDLNLRRSPGAPA